MPSALKAIPFGSVSCDETSKFCEYVAVDTSKPVLSVYSLTSSPVVPTTYILVPSVLNAIPSGSVSCADIEKLSTKDALLTS